MTGLVMSGVELVVRLGHASIGITLDTYSYVLPSISEGAANQVAQVIFGA